MKITFLGTGVGIPQMGRVQSGLIMEISGRPVLFDCGCGVLGRIVEAGYGHTDINTVVLTHLHLDHAGDLLALLKARWLSGAADSVHIYGPQGTQEWFGKVMESYDYLRGRFEVEITELSGGEAFSPEGVDGEAGDDCVITCTPTVHNVPSLAYRVESSSKAVVYTGDTEPSEMLFRFAEGADALIHECSFPLGFETTNHTTPDMLTGMMQKYPLEVRHLYLVHLYPHMQGHEAEAVEHIMRYFKGNITIASDLMKIEV
ncbi:MAG: MBL fold metallo-hydrolase [Methanolobus sp.]|nr:MBL fold metallo-hydrolase [Methanolobus sp.]MDP2215881.1 MBL fold metallo-hydrolase [Methanolobus sp.]